MILNNTNEGIPEVPQDQRLSVTVLCSLAHTICFEFNYCNFSHIALQQR